MNRVLNAFIPLLMGLLLMGLLAGFFWIAGLVYNYAKRLPTWAQWILVLPCALTFGCLAIFPLHWIVQVQTLQESEEVLFSKSTWATIELYANWLVIPFAFVFGGSRIAPRARMVTAIILASVLLILAALWLYRLSLGADFEIENRAKFFGTWILFAAGLSGGVYAAKKFAD